MLDNKLSTSMGCASALVISQTNKEQNILVLNGSLNPITKGHMMLAEKAYEHCKETRVQISKILFSPVHEQYPYKKVISSSHRIEMIKLAIKESKLNSIMEINYDEVMNPKGFLPTYEVMENLQQKYSRVFLVCGADLVSGMTNPDYWPETDATKLLNACEIICFLRSSGKGSISKQDLTKQIDESFLLKFKDKIKLVEQEIGEMSSSEARNGKLEFLADSVAEYVRQNKVF